MKTALEITLKEKEGGHDVGVTFNIQGMDECLAVFSALIEGIVDEPMARVALEMAMDTYL